MNLERKRLAIDSSKHSVVVINDHGQENLVIDGWSVNGGVISIEIKEPESKPTKTQLILVVDEPIFSSDNMFGNRLLAEADVTALN
ncbi:hypothetical protein ACOMCP_00625 [Lactiplantibacillus plantarum]|uniref:Uncharacterized protein n=1 Tax=Lactiplantibacillus plantarum TaxID=1590 RepID=A0A1E3KP93_LACPN|nr:hypothetical protein [Lactiplantibacillus plantarum]ODO60688.1 hypothetical protein LPJSA22_00633 [Lactiplantibacillus plantarum]